MGGGELVGGGRGVEVMVGRGIEVGVLVGTKEGTTVAVGEGVGDWTTTETTTGIEGRETSLGGAGVGVAAKVAFGVATPVGLGGTVGKRPSEAPQPSKKKVIMIGSALPDSNVARMKGTGTIG